MVSKKNWFNSYWCLYSLRLKIHKSMVNNRAKCLAISQLIRVKLYHSCLLFCYKKIFISMRYHVLLYLSYSSSYTLLFGPTDAYASVPSLLLPWEPNFLLSPLLSHPHQKNELGYKPIIVLALRHDSDMVQSPKSHFNLNTNCFYNISFVATKVQDKSNATTFVA
jgi:hypothetical protein